jgi:hypothetical protein
MTGLAAGAIQAATLRAQSAGPQYSRRTSPYMEHMGLAVPVRAGTFAVNQNPLQVASIWAPIYQDPSELCADPGRHLTVNRMLSNRGKASSKMRGAV